MNKRTLSKLAKAGETWVQTLARLHHQAYLVEALGYEHSGVPPAEFLQMVDAGILQPITEPRPANPFEEVIEAGAGYAKARPEELSEMRTWDTFAWKKYLRRQRLRRKPLETEHDMIVDLSTDFDAAHHRGRVPKARRLDMSPQQKRAYNQAMERAGIYCKRLGEDIGAELIGKQPEVWEGGQLLTGGDEALRRKRLEKIRRKTAEAVEKNWTPAQLKEALQAEVIEATRNWMRVATTELQAVFNEAVFLTGVEKYGLQARLAKIPETTACDSCLGLYLETPDLPLVMSAADWLRNGTNVGVPRANWKATLFPAHPNCRCSQLVVPPGFLPDRSGNLTAI